MKIENVINLVAVAVIAAHIGRKQQLKRDIQAVAEGFAEECNRKKEPVRYTSYANYCAKKQPKEAFCLDTREEGEKVIDILKELLENYGVVSVADLKDLIGMPSTYRENRRGWTDLKTASLKRTRYGYSLVLPDPEPIP
jgi:hypothetical protein